MLLPSLFFFPLSSPSRPPPQTVVTYNILCDAYVSDRSFPPESNAAADLAWSGREPRLIAEILAMDVDLVCLQEVQREAWLGLGGECGGGGDAATPRPDALGPALRAAGYEGGWFWDTPPPPGVPRSTLKARRDGTPPVGPALLVKSSRFTVHRFAAIAFRDARAAADLTGGHAGTTALLAGCRDGAVAAVLEDKRRPGGSAALILAASTHIHWDYRTPDLKVLQTAALLDELARFGRGTTGGAASAPLPPLIIGGDFNSLPLDRASNEAPGAPSCAGQPSGAYALLSSGALGPGHPHHPARQRGGTSGVTYTTAGWGALASVRGHPAEPAYTTRTTQFEGTLDYVFVSPGDWRVVGVLEDPPPGDAPAPSQAWPSDHFAVGAVVERR